MKRIDELLEEHEPEHLPSNPYQPLDPAREHLEAPLQTTSPSEPKLYEAEVYNYLITHKEALGIRKVFRLKNASADGEIALLDGSRVLVEIKYRMNWEKACQAGWQLLESFNLMEPLELSPTPNAGLVFFEQFSGDWNQKPASRPLPNGWYYWYAGHHKLREDFSAVLVNFQGGALRTYRELTDNAS